MTIKDIMDFVEWEIERLDRGSESATPNERLLWAAGKIAEETGEVWNDILAYIGLARPDKVDNITKEKVAEEIGDVILVSCILAKRLGIDLEKAIKNKIKIVESREYKDFYQQR